MVADKKRYLEVVQVIIKWKWESFTPVTNLTKYDVLVHEFKYHKTTHTRMVCVLGTCSKNEGTLAELD